MSAFNPAEVLAALRPAPSGVCADSREAGPGVAFAAFPGAKQDGREFIPDALRAGAPAILWDPQNFRWNPEWDIPNIPVCNLRERLGALADFVYRSPSARLAVVAATGANGKTTICHFAAQLLDASGIRAGIMGTAGNGFAESLAPSRMTTPDAANLHRALREMERRGAKAAAIEASSHGLSQGRLNGARIRVGVFANLGRDHLDYHGGMEAYFRAKARLFDAPGMRAAVVNADDERGDILIRELRGRMRVISFGEKKGERRVTNFAPDGAGGARFTITNPESPDAGAAMDAVSLSAPGRHNAMNFLAAILAAGQAGADWRESLKAAPRLTLPAGRMFRANPGARPMAFVDYAHAPDSLAAAIAAAREMKPRALWLVFGCGGNRDAGKRKLMGEAAAAADFVVVTDDNPRDENPEDIAAPVLSALRAPGGRGKAAARAARVVRVADRRAAIFHAAKSAGEGDLILVAGKGHEREQELENGRRIPFDDAETVCEALRARSGGGQ